MTDAERLLWSKLRNRRFARFKFRRQVPLGPFIADFACFERRLILELDGGQHTRRREYDAKRTEWLNEHGFRVVRFWNHELREDADAVDELIWRRLHEALQE
jgi:adenine-specific DNA-methyltransferase